MEVELQGLEVRLAAISEGELQLGVSAHQIIVKRNGLGEVRGLECSVVDDEIIVAEAIELHLTVALGHSLVEVDGRLLSTVCTEPSPIGTVRFVLGSGGVNSGDKERARKTAEHSYNSTFNRFLFVIT